MGARGTLVDVATHRSNPTFLQASPDGFHAEVHRGQVVEERHLVLRSGVKFAAESGGVSVHLPIPCLDGVFWRSDGDCLAISTDLRRLVRPDGALDATGIVSLLTFGTCVPPLTPYQQIRALSPGMVYEVDQATMEPKTTGTCSWSDPDPADSQVPLEEQERIVSETLDELLRQSCPSQDPVILFSGGVDSSVLALRAATMGWRGARLVHCSFGADHVETVAARAIAGALQLPLDVVEWTPERGYAALSDAGRIYPFPFGDHSCVPTYSLAHAVAERCQPGTVAIDGTGADADFGMARRSAGAARAYRLPTAVRAAFGAAYGPLGLYARPGRLERKVRLLRRSAQMGPLAFLAAQNPLAGIAYEVCREQLTLLSDACDAWMGDILDTRDVTMTYPLLDNAMTNAYAAAQKNRSPLSRCGVVPTYPFMEAKMVDLALVHARHWHGDGETKGVLKRMLARCVPRELVYRAKTGFTAPETEQFAHPTMLEHLRTAAEPSAPLAPFLRNRVLLRILDAVRSRRQLPVQTYNYLWSVAFASTWLAQVARSKAPTELSLA